MRKKERKLCVITSMMKKRTFKNRGQQKKKAKHDNIDDNERTVEKIWQKGKKRTHNHLNDDEKRTVNRNTRKREESYLW